MSIKQENVSKLNLNYDTSVPRNLEVTLYGNLKPYNDSISKCRVRIFYKGLNRNRTYISEDFAKQLIASLPYTPIKGIFNKEDADFEGHGEKNQDGRIYGVVMAEPNFAWEEHMDTDGVIRTYACADVLLYTALYNEAKLIQGSSQSMEINPYTFNGEWRIWEQDGQPYFHFTKGSLLGLQVLGMTTEPCFEGAAYYSLIKNDLQPLIDYVKQFNEQEDSKMDKMSEKVLYRLSDRDKASLIFKALNPDTEDYEGIKYWIENVYDDYAVCISVDSGSYVRVYYTKDDSAETVTIGEIIPCKIVDVTESEAKALDAMKSIDGTYEAAQAAYNTAVDKIKVLEQENETLNSNLTDANEKITTLETDKSNFETTIAEKDEEISALNTKYSTLENEKVELENEKNNLFNEKEELVSFKNKIEKEKKEQILYRYTEHLTDSIIEKFKENIDNYSVEDFRKEVCTAAVENDSTIFNNRNSQDYYYKGAVGGDSKGLSSLERILNNYKYGGNK